MEDNSLEMLLDRIFRAVLKLKQEEDVTALRRGETEAWDSLAHVLLVTGVEREFGLTMDLEIALELNTIEDFRRFLAEPAPQAEAG